MRRMLVSALGVVLAVAAVAQAPAAIQVSADGAVAVPGARTFAGATRLAALVKAAGVRADAYVLGAAWLSPSLRHSQTRLKAGLLYDLGVVRREAAADGQTTAADLAARLHALIEAMPVTGRKLVGTLEPHAVLATPRNNPPLADGDGIYYPTRPDTVTIVGAVTRACAVPHVGLRDARDYLASCPSSAPADPDLLYVIEPDGRVFTQGIAAWNRSPPMVVAPGAVLYVPLSQQVLRMGASRSFNRDMAAFLATQPVGREGNGR